MLKQSLTYTDYDGQKKTTEHFFLLPIDELVRLEAEFSDEQGRKVDVQYATAALTEVMEKLTTGSDNVKLFDFFKRLIFMSVGEQHTDETGTIRFRQGEDEKQRFQESMAYKTLFAKMCTDAEFAGTFFNGVMPAEVAAAAEKAKQNPTPQAQPQS